ncbi:Tic20 family protein [Alkalinema pantanalense CENA528]|uniref:Tic20 family protein n=1 Tax=Alkalinema pantanalense TaxID=1620705 RepID=UPI003D6FDB68
MTGRGSISPSDRFFSCLVYILPLMETLVLVSQGITAGSLLAPVFALLVVPLGPIIGIYYGFGGLLSFAIFLALYMLVVRNSELSHFLRYNVMQAILFGIVLSLISIVWQYFLGAIFRNTIVAETLFNTIFLGGLVAVGYSVIQTALGRYAEIPAISEAVSNQVRY